MVIQDNNTWLMNCAPKWIKKLTLRMKSSLDQTGKQLREDVSKKIGLVRLRRFEFELHESWVCA